MQRQYQREPLANEEVNGLINACETLREKQVILTLLNTGLRVSELARLTKTVLLLSLTVSFGVTVILAQPLTGSVIGIVRDEYGQALGSVHVTLLQVYGQPEAATRTDSHGFYHLAFVRPGMYNVQYQQEQRLVLNQHLTLLLPPDPPRVTL